LKDLTQYFRDKKEIIFKDIEEIIPKTIGSRKKIKIFTATSIQKEYYAIFIVDSNSRFIRKNAEDLKLLLDKLIEYKEHNFKRKVLLISSPLCSKAKKILEDEKWSVEIDFM